MNKRQIEDYIFKLVLSLMRDQEIYWDKDLRTFSGSSKLGELVDDSTIKEIINKEVENYNQEIYLYIYRDNREVIFEDAENIQDFIHLYQEEVPGLFVGWD